ncbi:hypothetical protein I4U23_003647 [Adineta vaga]|nr:hypothetical protein I4U23_003647 [Adineta vaga]
MSTPLSSSDVNLIGLLSNISIQANRYLSILIFLFGFIGNLLNILILSQRPLRSNPCLRFFLVSSIAYFICLITGLITRVLSTWNADFTNTNDFLCKLRAFLIFNSSTIANWLITVATIDRWLSSSANIHRRQKSTLKNAQHSMIGIIILSSVCQIQQIFCFEANLINSPVKCYTRTVTCGILSDISLALLTILIPLVLMFVFGLMIISNVRQTKLRVQPRIHTVGNNDCSSAKHQRQQRNKDRHLLIMLFVQVLLILICTLPIAILKIYTTLTRNTSKSTLEKTIENFLLNLFFLLFNIAAGIPFFIYTLTGGNIFRKTLFDLVQSLSQKLRRYNQD